MGYTRLEEARELNPIPEKEPGKRGRQAKGKIQLPYRQTLWQRDLSMPIYQKLQCTIR